MSRNLTEKQQKFLDVLFEEAQGNLSQARKLSGYAETVATSAIVNSLQDEIADLTKRFIAASATKAAYSMKQIMDSPTDLGNKEKMAAAKDVLDRAGLIKTDKVDIQASSGVFYLPPKEGNNE